MRIKQISLIVAAMTLLTACGTMKKNAGTAAGGTRTTTTPTATTTLTDDQQLDAIVATLGNWHTMQCGGNMSLSGAKSLSSSMQVRMVRDEAIYISLRPMLGIEVARLLITGDSVYAVDKVHRRYLAEKVSLLTAGIPVTVSTVQDIFLGRSFIIGEGTLNTALKSQVTVNRVGQQCQLASKQHYKGYGYAFTYDAANHIVSLDIVPEGSTTAAYQVRYGDVQSTTAGMIAGTVNVDARVEGSQFAFALDYDNMEWNKDVKIDRSVPTHYKRMSAKSLSSLLGD